MSNNTNALKCEVMPAKDPSLELKMLAAGAAVGADTFGFGPLGAVFGGAVGAGIVLGMEQLSHIVCIAPMPPASTPAVSTPEPIGHSK